MSDLLGGNRRAVRDALNELEGQGLLFRRQEFGTFVQEVGAKSASLKSLTNRTSLCWPDRRRP
jgi:DNA-binding GntR family transcriptional regulator